MATLTNKEREVLPKLIKLFDKLPVESKYYLLGYAQAQADKNTDGCRENHK